MHKLDFNTFFLKVILWHTQRSTKTCYPESIDIKQKVQNKPKKKSKGPRPRLSEQQLVIQLTPQNWLTGCSSKNLVIKPPHKLVN